MKSAREKSDVKQNSVTDTIRAQLFALQDPSYREFHSRLIPTVDREAVIGVRTPALRQLAKELWAELSQEEIAAFLEALPHTYYEENNLHGCFVEKIREYDSCIDALERFLPYVDNWATCDMISPKILRKYRLELLGPIRYWLASEHTYVVRFAMKLLMDHYLDEDFAPEYPAMVAGVESEEYYIRMMQAWYFATALAKQYEAVLPYLTEHRLPVWTHNKTIQKAVESYRITPEQKQYLKTLKRTN